MNTNFYPTGHVELFGKGREEDKLTESREQHENGLRSQWCRHDLWKGEDYDAFFFLQKNINYH